MYNKNSINDFTIIIPTFNRHSYLKRVLEFYQNHNVNIKIFDSSTNIFNSDMLLKSNIEYIHLPNMQPLDKFIYALEYTKTKYIALCADDDFIFIDAIKKCCNFLDKNDTYVCAQDKLISFKYSSEDEDIEYKIETYFTTNTRNSSSKNVMDRLSSFSQPYRHTFYGVHKINNILNIYKLIKQYELSEPYLIELAQAVLLVISGRVITFNENIYHLREMMKITSSLICNDIPTLININHPEVSILKNIIIDKLKQRYNISHDSCIEISETFFKNFCDFVQERKDKSQKFHEIHLNRNTIKKYDKQILSEIYEQEPDLKLAEELILKYKIFSGFLYQENLESKSLQKKFSYITQVIENLKLQIPSSHKIVIYGAGSFATLLIEVFNSQVVFIVDKDENLAKSMFKNKCVKSLDALTTHRMDYDTILVSVLGRDNEIKATLNEFNLNKSIFFCN